MTIPHFYQWLLRLYPRAFYARFGAEMQAVFEQTWAERETGAGAAMTLGAREFLGLLASLLHEHQVHREENMLTKWLHRLRIPLALLAVSLAVGAGCSLSYWGYLTPPASNIGQLAAMDDFALVRFDAQFQAAPVPISGPPSLVTDVFPPSQILPTLYARGDSLSIARELEAAFVAQLAAALAREGVDLGYPPASYPPQPVINPEGCTNCFQNGLQPQPDGAMLEVWPEFGDDGQFTGETVTMRVTPDDWRYYRYLLPAAYVVRGRAADGAPRVFVGLASNSFIGGGGDSFRYYEFVFSPTGAAWPTLARQVYRFDVSGFEGLTFGPISAALFIALLAAWLLLLLMVTVLRLAWRAVRPGPPAPLRA